MEFSSLKQISIFTTLLKRPGPKISSYFIIRVSHVAFLYESKTTQTKYLPGISYHSNFIDPLKTLKEILSLYPFLLKGFWENVEFAKNKWNDLTYQGNYKTLTPNQYNKKWKAKVIQSINGIMF